MQARPLTADHVTWQLSASRYAYAARLPGFHTGSIVMTLTPKGYSSRRKASLRPTTACLDAA